MWNTVSPACDQITRMIMPMASPPHRLGAHDRVAPFMFQRAQPSETAMERMAQRIQPIQ
jgi:hypothetical protein